MACISKLSAGFAYDCDTGATGIESAFIINKEDIASFATSADKPSLVTEMTITPSANIYRIDTPKRTLVIKESLKINESAPNAMSHEATLIITKAISRSSVAELSTTINPLTNGSYVIIIKGPDGIPRIYGLYYGLSANSIDRSTSDNGGWYTITLSTPEQVIGEDAMLCGLELYNRLYEAAVY